MRLRFLLAVWTAGSLVFVAAGCATVFSDTDEPVSFESEPDGATVEINGAERGETPVTVELDASEEYSVRITKSGFEPYEGRLTHEIAAKWLILDVVFFGLPLAVDALTGAWYEFDNGVVSVTLDRATDGDERKTEKKDDGASKKNRVRLSEEARALSAKKLFKRGAKHYGKREFPEALAYFQAAHEKSPSPVLLYNIAFAHSRLGEHELALETINRIEHREKLGKKVRTKLEALEAGNRLIVRGHRMVKPGS